MTNIDIKNNAQEQFVLTRRIGSTVYEVNVNFNQDAKETMDEKLLRIVKNRLNLQAKNDKMVMLQTSGLPERSSS